MGAMTRVVITIEDVEAPDGQRARVEKTIRNYSEDSYAVELGSWIMRYLAEVDKRMGRIARKGECRGKF